MKALIVVMAIGAWISLGVLGWRLNVTIRKGRDYMPLLLWVAVMPLFWVGLGIGQLTKLNDVLEARLKPTEPKGATDAAE